MQGARRLKIYIPTSYMKQISYGKKSELLCYLIVNYTSGHKYKQKFIF